MTEMIQPQDPVEGFVAQALEEDAVWGLQHEEGWALAGSEEGEEDLLVMPFWSSEAEARASAVGEWQDFAVGRIELGSFLEDWLPGMHEDGYRVGVNWEADATGIELEPAELALSFQEALDELEDEDEDEEG